MKIFLFLIFFNLFIFAQTPYPSFLECNKWNYEKWNDFLTNSYVPYITNLDQYSAVHRLNQELNSKCSSIIKRLKLNSCLKRIMKFYEQMGSAHGGMFSQIKKDDEYYASQPKERMKLPDEFAKARNGLPINWKEIADRNGWKWILFHSETAYEPRLIFIIKKNGYEQRLVYYTFNYQESDPTKFQGLQMQTIEFDKSDRNPPIHFRSWNFNGINNRPKRDISGGRCMDCHTNGPRAIVPSQKATFQTQISNGMTLDQFNNEVIINEIPDMNEIYNMEFIPSNLNIGKTNEYDCLKCHDGVNRSSLALLFLPYPQNYVMNMDRKLLVDKTMPPMDNPEKFKDIHREAFITQVYEQYQVEFKKWFTEIKCQDPSAQPKGPIESCSLPEIISETQIPSIEKDQKKIGTEVIIGDPIKEDDDDFINNTIRKTDEGFARDIFIVPTCGKANPGATQSCNPFKVTLLFDHDGNFLNIINDDNLFPLQKKYHIELTQTEVDSLISDIKTELKRLNNNSILNKDPLDSGLVDGKTGATKIGSPVSVKGAAFTTTILYRYVLHTINEIHKLKKD